MDVLRGGRLFCVLGRVPCSIVVGELVCWTGGTVLMAFVPASVAGFALGSELKIVHFLPVIVALGGLAALALLSRGMHWSPSLDAITLKYLVPCHLASAAMSLS